MSILVVVPTIMRDRCVSEKMRAINLAKNIFHKKSRQVFVMDESKKIRKNETSRRPARPASETGSELCFECPRQYGSSRLTRYLLECGIQKHCFLEIF